MRNCARFALFLCMKMTEMSHSQCFTTCSSSSGVAGDDETVCFGQRRGLVAERNTPSQLETKERPAKGPIAQSWLTLLYTSHNHTNVHTQSFIYPLLCFNLFPYNPFPHFCVLLFYPLCHVFWFCLIFYASYSGCSHISSASPRWMCVSVQSVREGGGHVVDGQIKIISQLLSLREMCPCINKLSSLYKKNAIFVLKVSCYESRCHESVWGVIHDARQRWIVVQDWFFYFYFFSTERWIVAWNKFATCEIWLCETHVIDN